MIRKRLLVTGLAMSMCLNQMPPTVLVKASQNTNSNSKFEVEVKNSKASKYGYIKPAGQSYATNPKSKLKKAAQLPAHYGSMGKDVRDQNPFGTCWAFAGTGSFEYAVDKKTGSNTDYSEEHMIQRLSKNGDTGYQITSKDTGGNEYMYSGYFTSGYGPVSDSLFPYDTTKSALQIIPSILNAKSSYRATDVQFFKTTDDANGALNSETVNTVKQAVYNNGSATCGITWDSSMIQEDKVSYYNNDDNARNDSNHEVLIVGWDDDYSADHFEGVTKNGAWLVRNSWGNNIGDNGYFWVSYQDKSLIPSCTIRSYEEVSDDDTIYNLDESGALYPQVTYDGTSQVGFINSFSLKKQEKLKEVTFYEAETGSQYQLFYVPVKDDGSLDIGNKQAITEKKTLNFPGYHTEKITKEINVKKAAIMVMIDSNEDSAGLGAEGSISDGRKKLYIPTLEKGQSYIYANGELGDLYDMGTNFGNWSIKLVTEKADSAFYAKDHKNSTDLGSFQWTGSSVKPSIGDIVSEDDGSVLKQGTDYELEYENNTNPGTATVKITGLGKYAKCSLTFTYTIENKTFHIEGKKDGDSLDDKEWTGEEINPSVGNVLSDYDNRVLEEGTDYKLVYSDNINVGTATVKVIGMGDYEGCNLTFIYKIAESCGYNGFYVENVNNGSDLSSVRWTSDPIRKKPGIIRCSHCKKELTEGTDYELEYKNNIDPGTATVTVKGIEKYKGYEQSFTYTIEHRTFHLNHHQNHDNIGTVKWTGKELKYDIVAVVDASGKRLEENKDYTVAYSNNVKPGTATVKVTGLGEYKDNSYDFTFEILEDCGYGGFYVEDLDDGASLGSYKWTGEAIEKRLTQILCKHCDRELLEGTDYTIEYSDNVEPGIATVKIIGLNQFKGYDKTYHYTIEHKTFHNSRFEDGEDLGTVEWTGKETTIDLEIILSDHQDELLVEGKDYEVTYSDNIKPGTAKVTITGLGDYKGCELNFTYKIHKTIQSTTTELKPETIPSVPNTPSTTAPDTATSTTAKRPGIKKITVKKAASQKIKALKKAFTINILKNKDQVTGYQISYSYKKNFKGQKVKTIKKFKYKKIKVKCKKYTIVSYKVKGLKRKKTVYVRVRAYKQVGKTKVYGKWSSVKKVKIK